MIQTKTFAVDLARRARLLELSRAIEENKRNPEMMSRLIIEHDALTKGLPVKLYDQREELQEVSQCS